MLFSMVLNKKSSPLCALTMVMVCYHTPGLQGLGLLDIWKPLEMVGAGCEVCAVNRAGLGRVYGIYWWHWRVTLPLACPGCEGNVMWI